MPRYQSHFVAAFAAIAITLVSMQAIVTVPPAQTAVLVSPAIA